MSNGDFCCYFALTVHIYSDVYRTDEKLHAFTSFLIRIVDRLENILCQSEQPK